jgi:outer membrane protein insertion porin family
LVGVLLAVAAIVAIPLRGVAQLTQVVVHSVNFDGNHAIDPDVLAASIVTTESSAFVRSPLLSWIPFIHGDKKYFNQTDFEADSARLLVLYKRSGYPDVTVRTALKRSTDAVDVTFKITQGAPVILQHFDIYGLDSVEKAYQIRQDLPIAAGDVASDWKLHEARDTIEARLRDRGYPRVRVDLIEVPHADTGLRRAEENAKIVVRTGPYSYFGALRVEAPPEIDTAFVASLIVARPGNVFRLSDIIASQRALYAADLFRVASVSIDTTRYRLEDTLNVVDSIVPLVVNVVPSLGHRATAQVGYGTDDCFRVGAGWTARNFIDEGLILDLTGQLSKIGVGDPLGAGLENNICGELRNDSVGSRVANYGLNASLRRNAFLSPDNSLAVSVFATQHSEFEVYLRQEVGASISFTRTTAANVPVTLSYRIADGTTSANPASFCAFFNTCEPAAIAVLQQRRVQGTLTLSVLRQRLNNPLDPSRGSILSASIATSSRFLGSSATQQFTRLIGDASGFLPINRNTVLAGHVRGGIIFAPVTDLGSDAGNFVPPDQRFYAGGSNDVRGYDQNQLGPLVYVVPSDSVHIPADTINHVPAHDALPASAVRVAPTGGTRVVIANLELRLPTPFFAGRLRYALFVDAGALWNGGGQAPLRITPGAGLRYTSPVGPIRLDVGYNTYPLQAGTLYEINSNGTLAPYQTNYIKQRTGSLTLHVSIGQSF